MSVHNKSTNDGLQELKTPPETFKTGISEKPTCTARLVLPGCTGGSFLVSLMRRFFINFVWVPAIDSFAALAIRRSISMTGNRLETRGTRCANGSPSFDLYRPSAFASEVRESNILRKYQLEDREDYTKCATDKLLINADQLYRRNDGK